jgi:hypothetical protein
LTKIYNNNNIKNDFFSNVIVLLEKHNADPNVIIPKLGIAPIHFAVGIENCKFAEEVIRLFIKKNANPNLMTLEDKLTPLHIACIWSRKNILKMFLDAEGDLSIKCNEGFTPIDYAIEGNYFDIIDLIKEHIFEQKIEKKKKEILLSKRSEELITPKKNLDISSDYNTPVKNLLQNIEKQKFTPNRINYNFDLTSPYYINITHRRHKTSASQTKHENSSDKKNDEYEDEKCNLFELTEKNLKEFRRTNKSAIIVERIGIHKRNSFIVDWRDKIKQIRNSTELDYSYINYLNACNNVTFAEDEKIECSDDENYNDLAEVKSITDESFVTAKSDLERNVQNIDLNNQMSSENTPTENYEEDYIHSDAKHNVILYEKKIKSKSIADIECSFANSSVSTIVSVPPLDYDTDTLRKELTNFGINPGPITKGTKKLYLKKLVKTKKFQEKNFCGPNNINNKNNVSQNSYPLEMQQTLKNYVNFEENVVEFLKLETRMMNHFLERSHIKWREGNLKTSFVYLLLDPRLTNNLSIHHKELSKVEVWKKFLSSIFYVGKGKSSRPYHHLYDAVKIHLNQNVNNTKSNRKLINDSNKLNRIIEIWKEDKGVVCLHIFHNIMPSEAYCREGCIIEALGIQNLTNLKRGEFYGITTAYTVSRKLIIKIILYLT